MVNDDQNNAANPIHLHDLIVDLSCVFVTAAVISRRSSLTKKLTREYEYYSQGNVSVSVRGMCLCQ